MVPSRLVLCVALVLLVATPALCDVYMHNPRGSNNRLNERSANRQNADRLFDSQNNNRGGYNVGDRGVNGFNDANLANGAGDPAFIYDPVTNSPLTSNVQYPLVYYEGSELSLEWTAQHGCGGNEPNDPHKLNCDMVVQYMCQTTDGLQTGGALKAPAAGVIAGAESLRDGFTTGTPDTLNSLTDTGTITNNLNKGHHESERYYFECDTRRRNRGLFLADQKLNGVTARYTRQNNNGNRRGLECPEERDYWPYWSPSPWKDVALLTDHPDVNCDPATGLYKGPSQNVAQVGKCEPAAGAAAPVEAIKAITEVDCDTAGGVWTLYSHNLPAPLCRQAEWSRVNHLGNGRDNAQPLMFNWTLPTIQDLTVDTKGNPNRVHLYTDSTGAKFAKCVVRLRYNISTDDFDPFNTTAAWNHDPSLGVISPVTNNPTVDIGAGYEGVRLAVNTAQFGRTFQDRSHIFYVRSRPTSMPLTAPGAPGKVYNLNVRGKRGNIVQTFPAVEYDFVPARLVVGPQDFVHVQWTGSNTHNNGDPAGDGQAGDAGEGRGGTDRSNVAELQKFNQNYPQPLDKFPDNMWSRSRCFTLAGTPLSALPVPTTVGGSMAGTPGLDCAVYMTTSGQFRSVDAVTTAAGQAATTANTFDPLLDNAPASLVGGVVMQFSGVDFPTSPATPGFSSRSFDYMCTRNNNFSNRGQKGTIIVKNPAANP